MIVLHKPELTLIKLLRPIPQVPLVICIGLNYRQHAKEAKVAATASEQGGNSLIACDLIARDPAQPSGIYQAARRTSRSI